jgi:hypothetical protein
VFFTLEHGLLETDAEVAGVAHRGGTTVACWSQNTKLPELGFHAVVGDSTHEVRFERLLAR